MPPADPPLLSVSDLQVRYRRGRNVVAAVNGVSFEVGAGKTLGLVGESGSGKTTIGRAILGLAPIHSGSIEFRGAPISDASRRNRRQMARGLQAIFQDPYSSLNPALKVRTSLAEAVSPHEPRDAVNQRLAELLERVGLPPSAADQYPSHFSGGQRQRLAVARALMAAPSLVVCDEPVSALDVSVQAQVLNLLRSLQTELSLSYLFIGHDLDVVRFMSHRIIVLYRGRVLEEGPSNLVARRPRSPYTQALVSAIPRIQVGAVDGCTEAAPQAAAASLGGSGVDHGCPFAHRCPWVIDVCRSQMPPLTAAEGGGSVACHRYPELVSARFDGPIARGSAELNGRV